VWRRLSKAIIARDHGLCQIKGERCTTIATCCDHIVEPDAGGARFAPSNLQASCTSCNASKGARYGNARREPRSERWY
jgi:5-methylcytosine-specific restriction endonuclease McrA